MSAPFPSIPRLDSDSDSDQAVQKRNLQTSTNYVHLLTDFTTMTMPGIDDNLLPGGTAELEQSGSLASLAVAGRRFRNPPQAEKPVRTPSKSLCWICCGTFCFAVFHQPQHVGFFFNTVTVFWCFLKDADKRPNAKSGFKLFQLVCCLIGHRQTGHPQDAGTDAGWPAVFLRGWADFKL